VRIYIASSLPVVNAKGHLLSAAQIARLGYERIEAPLGDPFEFAVEGEETIWCDRCDDHLPCADLCEHVWWCSTVGDYLGADGTVDAPCKNSDCDECDQRIIEAQLDASLASG
jgi:hypothetical protein